MSPGSSVSSDSNADEKLAGLLNQLQQEAREGKEPGIETIAQQFPDLALELRQLWATVQFADQFAGFSKNTRQTHSPLVADSTQDERAFDLPKQFGDYQLLEKLGQGGMGLVFKAWQQSLNRTVALKMILRGEHASRSDEARFKVEAEAAANLTHPNIVPVYERGEIDGKAYFSMHYVEGQTLSALLASGPLRPHEAARLLATISKAVQYAHQQGILHRDLKPTNVMIDKLGQPMVTDFGLAKRFPNAEEPADRGELTRSGIIVGTPAYMAPEQVSRHRGKPSAASDVYSLGVILYEMLTGRPPFQAASPVDTILLVLDQDPVQPRLLNPKVDADLEMICLKCLQKDPYLRYQTAGELAADLDAYRLGEPISVRTSGFLGLANIFNRMLRETHHAVVLENWGLLWMWHSVEVLLLCFLTNLMKFLNIVNPVWYLILWGTGLFVWGYIFWWLRKRGGPVLFVERQVAHVWGAAVFATMGVFVVEILLDLKVLTLCPILSIIAGMTFLVKAGMLSGWFYITSICLYLTAIPMALFPQFGPMMFGIVSALCFFIPGLKYHRQRLRTLRDQAEINEPTPSPLALTKPRF